MGDGDLPAVGSGRLSASGSGRLSALDGCRLWSAVGSRSSLQASNSVGSGRLADVGSRSSIQVAISVGYWSALSPLSRRIVVPPGTSAVIVVGDDEVAECKEEKQTNKRPALSGKERHQKFRDAKKQRTWQRKLRNDERELLFSSIRRRCNASDQYSDGNISSILRIGTCPSADVARAPLAQLISRLPRRYCWCCVTTFFLTSFVSWVFEGVIIRRLVNRYSQRYSEVLPDLAAA